MTQQPWMMRTYSGHSTARASNELYRTNLAKGQTGLSIAFDLPTQIGLDSDDPLSVGEVGKVGVAIDSIEDLLPGRQPGLDVICDGILTGSPFIFPAERYGVHDD